MSFAFQRPPALLVAMLGVAGFLIVTTGFATSAASQKEEPRKAALINQILDERQSVEDLDVAIAQTRAQVQRAQDEVGKLSATARAAQQTQDQLFEAAAMMSESGPAIVVRVSDAPRDEKTKVGQVPFGTDRVQDNDLQLIVNALFASGAKAIAVNENRISAVSPIRAAGNTILVNYRPVSSPYRIVAIGADKEAFKKTPVAVNFSSWKDKFKLGYSVKSSKKQTVPAYSGRISIDDALGN